jgi:dCTP diphosphatase
VPSSEFFVSAGPSLDDSRTTVEQLRLLVRRFVDERDWQQFHSPKNLSMALAIEAAELMEHFQWLTTDASREVASDARQLSDVAEELSDVICYALALANEMGIDISQSLSAKMIKNAKKYPAVEFRGRFGHDDLPKTT